MVGKPNKLAIPIRYKMKRSMFFNNDVVSPKINTDRIHVLSYNDTYPRVIELDIDILTKNGRFRIGEVMNILPPGIELDRKYHPDLNFSIAKMAELEEDKLRDWNILFNSAKMREEMKIAVTMNEKWRENETKGVEEQDDPALEVIDPENPNVFIEKENMPQRAKKDFALRRKLTMKEIIKAEGMEINPELAQMDTKKKR